MFSTVSALFAALIVCTSAVEGRSLPHLTPKEVGRLNFTQPAFVGQVPNLGPGGPVGVISSFSGNPFAKDSLSTVDLGSLFSPGANWSNAVVEKLDSNVTWPNTVTAVDPSAFGLTGGAVVLLGEGFLVPPKTVGSMSLLHLASDGSGGVSLQGQWKLSVDNGSAIFGGWFYHHGIAIDVDQDGAVDVLTARATKPILGDEGGQLVWLRNPGGSNPLASTPWEEKVLFSGKFAPDVFIRLHDINNDGVPEIIYGSFFSGGSVSFLYLQDGAHTPGGWSNATAIRQVVIDTSLGTMFDVNIADVNGDGALDLIATNHVDNASLAGVYAYEIPPASNIYSPSAWTRHTISSGFEVRIPGPGQAAPGQALVIPASSTSLSPPRPVVLVGGDADMAFYLISPSGPASSWGFEDRSLLHNCTGTTGSPLVGSFSNANNAEYGSALLLCYDTNELVGYDLSL